MDIENSPVDQPQVFPNQTPTPFDIDTSQPPSPNEQDWRANFSPDLQGEAKNFKTAEEALKAYINARQMIGKKVEEYSAKDWENYSQMRAQLEGIPSSPEDYKIDMDPKNDRQNTFTPEDIKAFKTMAHTMGLNEKQSQQLYDFMNEMGNQVLNNDSQSQQEYIISNYNELAKDWGNAWEWKVKAISNCVENILPQVTGLSSERIKKEIFDSGAYNNAILMKIFSAMGELRMDGASTGYGNLAPMDAQMRLDQKRSDPDWRNAIANQFHPMHQEASQELHNLIRMKNQQS
jgi:hypothetical protein